MSLPLPYIEADDKRSGSNSARHGLCSRVWCRNPAVWQAETASGQLRYACAGHGPDLATVGENGHIAEGAGDGIVHAAPFLKKYGA